MKSNAKHPNPLMLQCILVAMLAYLLSACGQPTEPPTSQPRLVKTLTLGEPASQTARQFPGRVAADRKADLAFQVSGPLIELPIKEGQIVQKGDLLARIDPRDYANQVKAGEANIDQARKQYERFAKLLKDKMVSRDQYEQQQAQYEIAQAAIAQARKNLEDTYLRAPFTGVVARRYVENFQNVRAKEPIVRLENIANLDVVIQLPEQDVINVNLDQAQPGTPVGVVRFEAIPKREFPVTLKKFETLANPQSQTYKVTLNLPSPEDLRILPGMTATVIPTQARSETKLTVFEVPVTAVLADENSQPYTWVVDKKTSTVSKRKLEVGALTGDRIRVLEGLESGETLVTAGGPYLTEGAVVRLQEIAEQES